MHIFALPLGLRKNEKDKYQKQTKRLLKLLVIEVPCGNVRKTVDNKHLLLASFILSFSPPAAVFFGSKVSASRIKVGKAMKWDRSFSG